jgi:hypothetical protein
VNLVYWDRIDDITGERVKNHGGTVTLALDKELIARRLYAAVNVLYQPEVTHFLAAGYLGAAVNSSFAWNAQVVGHAADQPGALDLVNFERHRAILRFGYHF